MNQPPVPASVRLGVRTTNQEAVWKVEENVEHYRKRDYVRPQPPDTLRVGQIRRIVKPGTTGHFQLEIILFYGPEDTGRPTSSFSIELYYN